MIEVLLGAGELGLGITVGFAGARVEGRWFATTIALGALVCACVVVYAAAVVDPSGEEPITWANWTFLGVALVGFWSLAVAMGYALSDQYRSTARH